MLMESAMDADDADANPALRQRIRARKVADLLESDGAVAPKLQAAAFFVSITAV